VDESASSIRRHLGCRIMKSDCEILVETAALAAVLTIRGGEASWRQAHTITIGPARIGLRITSAGIDAEIRGVGRWSRQVEVDADLAAGIAAKLVGRPITTMIYVANRLILNRFSLDAADRGSVQQQFKSPKPGQQWELDLGSSASFAPVRAGKLRPRRKQRDRRGLPLFATT